MSSLEVARHAHNSFVGLTKLASEMRASRDESIIEAHKEGVTAYRIAKALGIAESTIGRIIKRSQA